MVDWSIGGIWVCSWASEPKYLIYFGLLTGDKYNIGKITLVRGVKKLVISSNWTWKLRQINLVQFILEAHDDDKEYKQKTTMQMDI